MGLFFLLIIFVPVEAYDTMEAKRIYIVIVYSILVCIQVYFLTKRGQSIGKMLFKIRISLLNNPNEVPSFFKVIILRIVINDLMYVIPIVGLIYLVLNYCLALFKPQRCIHDYIAGTIVVKV
ncbi:MAG: RDD family protein [Methylococcales bacterium]|nr:RDD family protein [Methylococcales bacterium]